MPLLLALRAGPHRPGDGRQELPERAGIEGPKQYCVLILIFAELNAIEEREMRMADFVGIGPHSSSAGGIAGKTLVYFPYSG